MMTAIFLGCGRKKSFWNTRSSVTRLSWAFAWERNYWRMFGGQRSIQTRKKKSAGFPSNCYRTGKQRDYLAVRAMKHTYFIGMKILLTCPRVQFIWPRALVAAIKRL